MAKVRFIDPIESVSGKLAKSHRTVYCHRNKANAEGIKINYTIVREPNPNRTYTATQKAAMERFAAIALLVKVRKNDPDKMAADAAAFQKQSAYKTMTKYLWAKCSEEYDNA